MKKKYKNVHRSDYGIRFLTLIILAGLISCEKKPFSKSAEEALSTFTIDSAFKIELVASEPMVSDPVAMEIDEYGRMYVVEMHGYPLDLGGTGKVKLLTDTDGDGVMDKHTVFAEGLILPTGIMRWKQGVIVTDPPNVLYLEDKDGDGKADVKETLLTGFAVSNPQHNTNNPLLGVDNWIYLGHESAISTTVYKEQFGDSGSEITFPGVANAPKLPQNAGGRSVRFRPDENAMEILSSKTQFGHTFDAWGHYLLVSNSNHVQQEVIPAAYLRRNTDLLVSSATVSLSDHGNAAEVFPTTKNPELQMLTNVGVMTSACGITAYLGNAFPEGYNDDITFVAEPVSNLVHADRLVDKGATFTAKRVHEKKEFLTSTDSWFRPVNMYVGPDGALYLVDYYRQIIEHPEWMSEEVNQSGALYNGTDKGRIYRISGSDAPGISWTKELANAKYTNESLVEKLADKNIWWRRNAQRMLVDRRATDAVPALVRMTKNSNAPMGRLHALWTLEGIGQLQSSEIRNALHDKEPGIRENVIRLAELHLAADPSLSTELLALGGDADPKVRFQLLCALGYVKTPEADKLRQDLLFKNIDDPWMQIAALSAPESHRTGLLDAVLARFSDDSPAYASLVERLSAMTSQTQDRQTIQRLITQATSATQKKWQGPILQGLAQGLKNKEVTGSSFATTRPALLKAFFQHPSDDVRKGCLNVLKAIGLPDGSETKAALQRAWGIAANKKLPPMQRAEAIELLSLTNPAPYADRLKSLIVTEEALPVQVAVFKTLSAIPDETVSRFALERFPSLTPELRDAALNTFLTNPERVKLLLDAVESNAIPESSVGFYRSVRLRTQSDVTLRNRARALFGKQDAERKNIIEQYQPALDLRGDHSRGKEVFKKSCSSCHQVRGGSGIAYGPDLGTVHNWPPAGIMTHILDPNLSISDGFDVWEVTLNTGETAQGIISTETPNALTLRNAGGQETTIARQDIASLKTLGMSTMPTGLEAQIDQQGMADLLAFLRRVD
jgi:putative membrane-bound dehydrogenase-like protein